MSFSSNYKTNGTNGTNGTHKEEPVSTTSIDFDKYDEIPVETSGRDCPSPISVWKDVDLGEQLHKNIENAKYTKPTPVQKYSLPIVINGRDLMSCAQTGSGKTAAFLLPIIARLLRSKQYGLFAQRKVSPVALVLAPTRELACQIYDEARKFAQGSKLKIGIVYGGVPIRSQIWEIERGCDILVATPGRLTDIISQNKITLSVIQFLVLDEADRMLDMGFEPQIRKIVEQCDMPPTGKRQTLMFSATFAKEIQSLAASFLHDYVFLTIGRVGSTTDLVTQKFLQVADSDKELKLLEVLASSPKGLTLIFVETKKKAARLEFFLKRSGWPASSIHGDRDQRERTAALKSFSSGVTPYLIATNVAARGLDIGGVTHVINLDMPSNIDDYVHRIGRTGRAGKKGMSTAFISPYNDSLINDLLEVLHEAGQEVPSWLEGMRRYRGGGSGGGRGAPRSRGGSKFGGRDFRQQSGGYGHGYGQANGYGHQARPYQQAPYQYNQQQQQQQPYAFAPPTVAATPYSNTAPSSYPAWPSSNPYQQAYSAAPATNGWKDMPSSQPSSSSSSSSSGWNSYQSTSGSTSTDDRKRRYDQDHDSSSDKYRRTDQGRGSTSSSSSSSKYGSSYSAPRF